MFIAKDECGNRIEAKNASKEQKYYCPSCGGEVILRAGELNAPHFAHLANECIDKWNYDMSEWHIKMQSFFPVENREIVVEKNGKIHRADVLKDNTVIEMQHSPISAEEFNDRNYFFARLGYRIIWIFDVRDKWKSEQIECLNDNVTEYKWTNPLRIFDTLHKPLSDNNNRFAIYLHLFEEDFDDTRVSRVVKTTGNKTVDFSRFEINEWDVIMENLESIDEFFIPEETKKKTYASERIKRLKAELGTRGLSYAVKYIGQKGKPKDAYICKRRNNRFGLKYAGEEGCLYCKYCALIVGTYANGKDKKAIYCCYPDAYREPDKYAHPGYECCHIEEIDY